MNSIPSQLIASSAPAIGCATGGAAAVMALASAPANSPFGNAATWHVLYESTTAVRVAGAIAAVVVSSAITRRRIHPAMTIAGLLIATALVFVQSQQLLIGYIVSVAAGIALAGLLGLATSHGGSDRSAARALALGTICGIALCIPLSQPRRFLSYLDVAEPIRWTITALAIVAVIAVVGATRAPVDTHPDPVSGPAVRRTAIFGIGLAVVSLLVNWWFTADVIAHATRSGSVWWYGYLPVVVTAIGGLVLSGTEGALIVVVTAWSAMRAREISWVPESLLWALVVVACIIGAGYIGSRVGRPIIGIGVLALCAASYALVRSPFDDVYSGTTLFVAPAAVAFAISGIIATSQQSAPALATALPGPIAWTIAPGLFFVVSAGYSEGSADTGQVIRPSLSYAISPTVAMVLSVVLCGITLAVMMRRRHATDDAPLT